MRVQGVISGAHTPGPARAGGASGKERLPSAESRLLPCVKRDQCEFDARSHLLPPLYRAFPEPHPSDRCGQGTLDEPPGVHRALQPPPTRQLLEGFRFP